MLNIVCFYLDEAPITVVHLLQVPEGVQNTGAEVSELQLMAENQINMEATTEAAEEGPPQTGRNVAGRAQQQESCRYLHCPTVC